MQDFSSILFQILDGLIKVLLPVVAGIGINYLNKKIGREKFMLAKDVVSGIVSTLEQQYRSGEIPKDDRFALAIEQGIKRTGLSEEQVVNLIKEAVFVMNVQMRKYDYSAATDQGFTSQGDAAQVLDGQTVGYTTPVLKTGKDLPIETTIPVAQVPLPQTNSSVAEASDLIDSLVNPQQQT